MIAILLTTYNSHLFLKDLLDSLQKQTYSEWDLYIRDDQSSDDTVEIISQYVEKDKRIHLLQDEIKRGAMNGFMWLLEQVEADYYMFCDHDDVWNKDKIALSLKKMQEYNTQEEKPILVHTDLEIVDENLKSLHPSYWAYENFCYSDFNSKYFHLPYNNITGCTMMINHSAKRVSFPVSPFAQMHDWWIAACVLWNNGIVLNIPKATILYRQHSTNTIGAIALPPLTDKIRNIKAVCQRMREQAFAAKDICGMHLLTFIAIKCYYMSRLYLRNMFKRTKK